MIAAGAPAVWNLREASEPSLFAPYLVRGFLFLSWGAAWAVLAAWVWRATRPTRGWRRSAGALAAVLLALSALVSFAFGEVRMSVEGIPVAAETRFSAIPAAIRAGSGGSAGTDPSWSIRARA